MCVAMGTCSAKPARCVPSLQSPPVLDYARTPALLNWRGEQGRCARRAPPAVSNRPQSPVSSPHLSSTALGHRRFFIGEESKAAAQDERRMPSNNSNRQPVPSPQSPVPTCSNGADLAKRYQCRNSYWHLPSISTF